MEFIDLKKQYERIKPRIQDRINEVLRHGKFIMGPEVAELEQRLASFVGASTACLAPAALMPYCSASWPMRLVRATPCLPPHLHLLPRPR